MQISEAKSEGLLRSFDIVIPKEAIADRVDQRLKEISNDVKLPGFRPGKVPLNLMRQRYGKSVMGEVFEAQVNESVAGLIEDKKYKTAGQPRVEDVDYDEGKDLKFRVDIDLMPEIGLMDMSSLKLERFKVEAPQEQIDSTLERIAKQSGTTEPARKGTKLKEGLTAVIDFQGEVDGKQLPGMDATDFNLEIGSGAFVPGFEEQLIGAKQDDALNIEVKFPDDYGSEDLAGKDTKFAVTVKEVRKPSEAKLDDDFAKNLGLESLDQLIENIKADLERNYGDMANQVLKRSVLDAIDEKHDFDLPGGMVKNEFEGIWKQIMDAKAQGQLDEEEANKDEDALKAEYEVIAARRVKLGLVMQEIATSNNLKVEEEDMRQALYKESMKYPGQQQEFMQYMQNTPGAMQSLSAPVLEDKVVAFIAELSGAKESTISVDDLNAKVEALNEM